MPLSASVAPVGVRSTEATLFQAAELPVVAVGALGAVRSRRAVLPALAAAGAQAEVLPALSRERNCTIVWPSALISTELPLVLPDQVVPPLVDVRYS